MSAIAIEEARVEELAEMFRLMGDANRLRILMLVLDRPRAVGEIAAAAGLSQSLVSHNLGRLRVSRLVRAMRGSLSIREQIRGRSLLRVLLPRDATEGVAENQAGVVTNRF